MEVTIDPSAAKNFVADAREERREDVEERGHADVPFSACGGAKLEFF